jgi:hypothetical protein
MNTKLNILFKYLFFLVQQVCYGFMFWVGISILLLLDGLTYKLIFAFVFLISVTNANLTLCLKHKKEKYGNIIFFFGELIWIIVYLALWFKVGSLKL